jgi:hypothetical protein
MSIVAEAAPARPPAQAEQPANKFLEYVTRPAPKRPTACILFAGEGWGKTSFAAQAPSPIFLCIGQETGLFTLVNSGRLPQVPHFPEPAQKWSEVHQSLNLLLSQQHPFKTLCIDTIGGCETLLHQEVCDSCFGSDWGETGFGAFNRGVRQSVPLLSKFLAKIDELRDRGMSIILLAHCNVTPFRSPDSADYDRYQPAVTKDSWAVLHRWADCVLFGHRRAPQLAGGANRKAKGKLLNTDQPRVLMTERCAAWDAKNRHGLPPEIPCGSSSEEAWANFTKAMKGSRDSQ